MMGDGIGMGLGAGFMWLFWIVLIILVVWGIKLLVVNDSSVERKRTALEILEERYAKGEIDRDEFKQRKSDLSG